MARDITTYGENRDDWQRLTPALEANAADLPHLEAPRIQLESVNTQVGDLLTEQAALSARKQEVSKRLQALIAEGRQLAAFLRAGVRQRYGNRSEKLAEFHLVPFRGRKAAKPEEEARKNRREAAPTASTPEITK